MAADDDVDIDEPQDDAPPPPKTSGLTIVLCVLNVLAAIGFTYLLLMDYSRRQGWSHAVFMHDLKIVGLPLKSELTEGTSLSRLLLPKANLDPAALKEAYTKRGGKPVSEPFESFQDSFQYRILREHLTSQVLSEQFQGVGQPVETLEDEIARIKTKILDDIASAAKEIAAEKTDKRERLSRILMSLGRSTDLVERLEQKIKEEKELDETIADAAQRRMLVDILAPLEVYRGGPLKKFDEKAAPKKRGDFKLSTDDLDNALTLDNAADRDLVPLKRLQDMLTERLDAAVAEKYDPSLHFGPEWRDKAADAVDRRKAIANILCVIAQTPKPDSKEPSKNLLYPDGPERAMAVVGVYEYTLAYQNLTRAFFVLRPHIAALIEADREGLVHQTDGEKRRIGGFVQDYNREIDEIRKLIKTLSEEEKTLGDLRDQAKGHEDIVTKRNTQVNDNTAELLKSRAKTAERTRELERLQRELFEAQQQLVNAVQRNRDLLNDIRKVQGLPPIKTPAEKQRLPDK